MTEQAAAAVEPLEQTVAERREQRRAEDPSGSRPTT